MLKQKKNIKSRQLCNHPHSTPTMEAPYGRNQPPLVSFDAQINDEKD
jgi:hypothetical protein